MSKAPTRIRGYIGEQSFEITEGFEHLDQIAEAMVFGSVYRANLERDGMDVTALTAAMRAVKDFRKTRRNTPDE